MKRLYSGNIPFFFLSNLILHSFRIETRNNAITFDEKRKKKSKENWNELENFINRQRNFINRETALRFDQFLSYRIVIMVFVPSSIQNCRECIELSSAKRIVPPPTHKLVSNWNHLETSLGAILLDFVFKSSNQRGVFGSLDRSFIFISLFSILFYYSVPVFELVSFVYLKEFYLFGTHCIFNDVFVSLIFD